MKRRYLISSLIACAMTLIMLSDVAAQVLRPERTVFIKPRVGLSHYYGDYHTAIDPGFGLADKYPWSLGLEIGYQFSPNLSLAGAYQIADYPTIVGDPDRIAIADPEAYTRRHTGQLLLRLAAGGLGTRVAPFLTLGGQVSSGKTTDSFSFDGVGYGAVVGLGIDIVLTDRASLTFEAMSNLSWPDGDAPPPARPRGSGVDGADFGEAGGFDLLSFLGLGLRYNFTSAIVPVEILSVDCPTQLEVGESGTFTSTVNEQATMPVEYRWDFGDGATATGILATHTYSTEGTYNVTFTASNRGGTDSRTCTVTVVPAPVPAEVVTLSADQTTFELCEPVTVQFNANVRGDMPITYEWNFGDGTTGTGPNPTHTYTQPGTYTVTLNVSNESGTDTRTLTINALECVSICDEITELNSVYFDRNSSTLTTEARAALQENLEILQECPDICVRVEGFAAPGERNTQSLSEDRARAVEQYYIDNGIAASRILAVGQGRVPGTTKKEAGSQFRRADSIPVPCTDLNAPGLGGQQPGQGQPQDMEDEDLDQ